MKQFLARLWPTRAPVAPAAPTDGLTLREERDRRNQRIFTRVIWFSIGICLFFAVLYTVQDARRYWIAILVNLAVASLWGLLLTPWAPRGTLGRGLYFMATLIVSLSSFTLLLGTASGSHVFLLAAAVLPTFFLGARLVPVQIAFAALAWLAFILAGHLIPEAPYLIPMSLAEAQGLFLPTTALTVAIIFATTRHTVGIAERAEDALTAEYRRSEDLLTNVMPRPVAERLKKGESVVDALPDVSVLFADIVGFTGLAHDAGPERTVQALNRFFTLADELAAQFGCEKIKTIGDCVMFAAGVPQPDARHAARLAGLALELNRKASALTLGDSPIRLRSGCHSGPVVAGIIGQRRFAYDLWGDTVNLAARLQSAAEPGQILMSKAFGDRLDDAAFRIVPVAAPDLRGFGTVSATALEPAG